MKLWKYSGILLMITGVVHCIVGVVAGHYIIADIFQEGVFDTINWKFDQNFIFWFLTAGVMFIVDGYYSHQRIKETNRPMPKATGIYLLIFAVVGSVVAPVSGIWLFYPQAIIILIAKPD